jgi:hypothetical protein
MSEHGKIPFLVRSPIKGFFFALAAWFSALIAALNILEVLGAICGYGATYYLVPFGLIAGIISLFGVRRGRIRLILPAALFGVSGNGAALLYFVWAAYTIYTGGLHDIR